MRSFKYLTVESKNLEEIKGLIEVYEEIAASNMQKVRKLILSCRDFFESLEKMSEEIGSDINSVTAGEQKTAVVFISSNGGLYGEIIDKTFRLFLDFIRKNKKNIDVYVLGKLGQTLIKTLAPEVNFKLLQFQDQNTNQEDFDTILKEIFPYKKIVVFYGKFYNIAIQHPYVSNISGELLSKTEDLSKLSGIRFRYLYEPSLKVISEIFAGEILSSSLEQILRESQLAKYASRLVQLDQTLDNIKKGLGSLGAEKRQLIKKIRDKKQNAMISGIMARKSI